jgi:acyl-CoA hydrolase
MPISFTNEYDLADAIIGRVGKTLKLAAPLAAGKANHVLNALYQRARQDPSITLEIYTALTVSKPRGRSLLEKRFIEPFADRVFGDYPNLDYHYDREDDTLPANVRIIEFYFPAGKQLDSRHSQENYVSSNYTHVARDLLDAGVNVISQIVAVDDEEDDFSLSCNPDVTPDLMDALGGREDVAFIAQVNRNLPFMYGDAVVAKDCFDFVLDNPAYDFQIFAPPKMPVSDADHMIGTYVSSLVKDGGELQIGIGALGDSLINALLLRHQQNDAYREVLKTFDVEARFGEVIAKKGDTGIFEEGLLGATEMLVDCFMFLVDAGILKRRVYDHVILQRLLNEGLVSETVDRDMLYHLLERRAIHPVLRADDFRFLQRFGIFREGLKFENGLIYFEDGSHVEADFNQEANADRICETCLGERLANGAIIHGGFFIGPQTFYDWLRKMPKEQRRLINMRPVTRINQLYGHEALDRLHRKHARCVNSCLKMTLFGAAVSDGLDDGRVVSGVGGQYNFVAMAHELADGHSVIQVRSTRTEHSKVLSNIVFNYGHVTIPRHLRDIVVTEYGIADIRGKTDTEVAAALIEVADSRFQEALITESKRAGKLHADYRLPDRCRNNTPESISDRLAPFKARGLFARFPFGTDFTDEELVLGKALKSLKAKAESKLELIKMLLSSPRASESELGPYLERMALTTPKTFEEKISARLLKAALAEVLPRRS